MEFEITSIDPTNVNKINNDLRIIVEGIIDEENDSTKVPPQQEDSIVVSRLRREISTPMQLYVITKTPLYT